MDLIQLKIEKDNSAVKYIKIIREFDSSLSMGDIKRKIDEGDFAVEFDLEDLDVLDEMNDIDRKQEFRDMIESLINADAKVTIFHNGDEESLEFLDNWLDTLDEIERQTD
ncbi:MAG: hypothetical protein K2N56_03870 [Oscillospiraceae bacterium]|nr:hypothetical protein [Oscillospiraceae bacterium]